MPEETLEDHLKAIKRHTEKALAMLPHASIAPVPTDPPPNPPEPPPHG